MPEAGALIHAASAVPGLALGIGSPARAAAGAAVAVPAAVAPTPDLQHLGPGADL